MVGKGVNKYQQTKRTTACTDDDDPLTRMWVVFLSEQLHITDRIRMQLE